MESQPQNLEFRKKPEKFHPCIYLGVTAHSWVIYSTNIEFLSLKMVLVSANSEDSDEMPHYGAFHLDLHCLPKYPFGSFPFTKGRHICEISLTVHLCMSNLASYLVLLLFFI